MEFDKKYDDLLEGIRLGIVNNDDMYEFIMEYINLHNNKSREYGYRQGYSDAMQEVLSNGKR